VAEKKKEQEKKPEEKQGPRMMAVKNGLVLHDPETRAIIPGSQDPNFRIPEDDPRLEIQKHKVYPAPPPDREYKPEAEREEPKGEDPLKGF